MCAASEERGISPRFVESDRTTRSAAEAAEALGCRVEQIVKSLVFRGSESGKPVLVRAGGPDRVSEARISHLIRELIEKADAAFVRDKPGFAIGGVPLVGHAEPPVTFPDEILMEREEVWAAGGHTLVVFGLGVEELWRMTGGRVIRVKRAVRLIPHERGTRQ